MKRIQLVGLCIVALFAFSAMAAASASAAPEYGQCKTVKKGKYTNSGCTTTGKKAKKEWFPGRPANCEKVKKGKYTNPECTTEGKKGKYEKTACSPNCAVITAKGGAAFLEAESGIKIECATNGSEGGEILSATEADGKAVYTGCHIEALGGVKCTSAGAATGEIKTNELRATPEEKGGKVWVNYTAKNGGYLAEFACEVVSIRVSGNAAGKVTGGVNEMSVKSTQTFARSIEGIEGQNLTSESNTGKGFEKPEKSWQNQTTEFESHATGGMEIRT